jgi:hypothetical protein
MILTVIVVEFIKISFRKLALKRAIAQGNLKRR